MKQITQEEILDLISMRPLSFEQIASELKLEGEERVALCSLLDEMRFSRRQPEKIVLGLRINPQAPVRHERICGPDTYLYYRLDERVILEQKGLLPPEKLIPPLEQNFEEITISVKRNSIFSTYRRGH